MGATGRPDQLIFFGVDGGGGASVKLSVMSLHRHRAIIWYAYGVAWLNSMEVGCSKHYALC